MPYEYRKIGYNTRLKRKKKRKIEHNQCKLAFSWPVRPNKIKLLCAGLCVVALIPHERDTPPNEPAATSTCSGHDTTQPLPAGRCNTADQTWPPLPDPATAAAAAAWPLPLLGAGAMTPFAFAFPWSRCRHQTLQQQSPSPSARQDAVDGWLNGQGECPTDALDVTVMPRRHNNALLDFLRRPRCLDVTHRSTA
jgi:hypothetical protein